MLWVECQIMNDTLAKNGHIATVELEGEGNSPLVIMSFRLNLIFWNKKKKRIHVKK